MPIAYQELLVASVGHLSLRVRVSSIISVMVEMVQGVVSHHHQGLMVLILAFGMAFGSIKESGLSPRRFPEAVDIRTLRALVGAQRIISIGMQEVFI